MEQKYEQFKGQPRLPKFAVPKRYDINLKPDLISCKFAGAVQIFVDIVADTNFIVLNAAELAVDRNGVRFTDQSGSKVWEPVEVELFEGDEILVLEFAENLPLGLGVLCIAFEGILNENMKGFYRSTYEHNGEKKNMAVTQFEPADARRCFPCWDEPACKATFKITLEVPSELVALSNMPVIQEEVDGNIKTVHYQESPIMSTYLVAVVIGLFDYVEDHTSDGIKVRVYCQVGKENQGKFALDLAVKTLDLFKKYFSVPYSLPKLDMVAIPDFAAGAMENYGLVTYRETALLYDDKHSAAANKQRVATVVAHELAHQWFGNLVTMEWWTHLWLNEGFATWVSYLATDSLFPEWKIWTQFLDESTEGLRLDGLAESHPIEVEINHAREIDEIFDAISYRKGASVIRMLQSYLGPECFQRALASYIRKHSCSNAKTEDLWTVLEEESGEPVNKLMNSWTKQKGYPVVSVTVKGQNLEFEQSQFLLSGSKGDGQWIVPITLCCSSYDTIKNFLLHVKSETLDTKEFLGGSISEGSLMEPGGWIKVNVDQAGFYRVKYDEELAGRLRYAVETKCLSATDRFGILDDSYALCMACQQPLASLLSLMGAFRGELEYTVLSNLISVMITISCIHIFLQTLNQTVGPNNQLLFPQISYKVARIAADAAPELLDYIKQFFINLFQCSAEKLGWDPIQGESHLDAMLRGELLTALAQFGHDGTQNEASRRFDAFLDDRNTALLPPDIRKAAYVAVMQNVTTSKRSGYESLLRVYRETDQSQEKTRILGSLASCPNPEIVLEVLNFVLSPEVRSQDAIYGVSVGVKGRETAWRWLKDNWDHILKTFGSGFLISNFVSAVVSPFSSYEKANEVEEFFANRSKLSIARTLKQSLERVHINAKWVQSIQNEQRLAEVVEELSSRKT
ncbi:AP-1 complex subunit mu-1-like [Sarracenia purpurea var. burkii]